MDVKSWLLNLCLGLVDKFGGLVTEPMFRLIDKCEELVTEPMFRIGG